MAKSQAEILFTEHLSELERDLECPIVIEAEHKFHLKRKWKADFVIWLHTWKKPMGLGAIVLAIEIEGGTRTTHGGRHRGWRGYLADLEKYNALTMQGYRLLRFTTQQVLGGEAKATTQEAITKLSELKH